MKISQETRTVLVVDDETMVRFLIADFVRDLGLNVVEATTGEDALQLFERSARIDLVITDMRMPGISGLELVKRIRLQHPALPAIYVTGYAMEFASNQHSFSLNSQLLTKPFELADLESAIERALPGKAGD